MKNFLLPFLGLAMMLVVGCTEDFDVLDESDVTQPVITSSLDDVTFSTNFTIKSTGTSSFVIDPKQETITRSNFEIEFGDSNYNDSGDAYLTAVITESSAVNGYTIRFTPTTAAVNLISRTVVECSFSIVLDDGRYTKYTMDVILSEDQPTFDEHPTSVEFPTDFTVDSLVYTTFTLRPGPFTIDLEDISISTSYRDAMFRQESVEVIDIDDSTGYITYEIAIRPTTTAVDYDAVYETTSYVTVKFKDDSGTAYSIESYDFDLYFNSDWIVWAFYGGMADVTITENYTATHSGTTTFQLTFGTSSAIAGYVDIVYDYEDYVTISWAWTSTTSGVGKWTITVSPIYDIKTMETYLPGGITFPVELRIVNNWEDVYDWDNPVEGEGYQSQTFNVTLPPWNENKPPLFASANCPTLITFASDFSADWQYTRTTSTAYTSSQVGYTWQINSQYWTDDINGDDTSTENVKIWVDYPGYDNPEDCPQYGWVDTEDFEVYVSASSTQASSGYSLVTYGVYIKPTQTAVDALTEHYYGDDVVWDDIDKNPYSYNNYIGDSGEMKVYMRVWYNNTTEYTDSPAVDVRFLPWTPTHENTTIENQKLIGIGAGTIDGDTYPDGDVLLVSCWTAADPETVDGAYRFSWYDAYDVCAAKEPHEKLPWGWRLPGNMELTYLAYGKATIHTMVNNTDGDYRNRDNWWSNYTATTGPERAQAVYVQSATRYNHEKTELFRVICVTDKYQNPDTDVVPDIDGFN